MIRSLRDEALLILDGRGAIIETARDITRVLRERGLEGAVIGGVAVVLHGHVRTTAGVDVYVPAPAGRFAEALTSAGYTFDAERKEFVKKDVPVHIILADQARIQPTELIEIDDIRTVSLVDLINLKLDLGTREPLRAQDLADVIGLIRCHGLTGAFAPKIAKPLRSEFRKLAKAVADQT